MTILENEPLAPRTTFKVGGSVRFLVEVETAAEVPEAFLFARARDLPTFILGGGSNVLADDGLALGVCIVPKIIGVTREHSERGEICVAGAGESWDGFVTFAIEHSLWGVENLSGIPGSVGGAVVQNAGAYGAEIADTLAWVEAYDTLQGVVRRLSRQECAFGYRRSCFKDEPGRFVILHVAFLLASVGVPNVAYRDLAEHFSGVTNIALSDIRNAVLAIRAGKFPDLSAEGTAGSFFKNPSIPIAEASLFAERYRGVPVFENDDGATMKLSLAWLFDRVLGLRGLTVEHVRAYERQPLVIVVQRGATARDVRTFARDIQKRAHDELALSIEPEVCIMHGAHSGNTL